jgi:hypothetical protein
LFFGSTLREQNIFEQRRLRMAGAFNFLMTHPLETIEKARCLAGGSRFNAIDPELWQVSNIVSHAWNC